MSDDTIILTPPNEAPIRELWAFLSIDEKGNGIVAGMMPNGQWMMLVTGKQSNVELMKPIAKHVGELTQKPIKLVRFVAQEVVWEVGTS